MTPHDPWFLITLYRTVSYLPPESSTPAPMAGCRPEIGTSGLSLPTIRLCSITVHDLAVCGQRPSCGGGASSLLSEFGAMPVRLRMNSESLITSRPPALVPE